MTTKRTSADFKRFARDIAPDARRVLAAQANAELERERVDAYITPILQRYAFTDDLSTDEHRGTLIEKVGDLYLSTDEARLAAFYAECDQAHRAHGFTGPEGHCPALIAENLHVQAKQALLKQAGEFFGAPFENTYGEQRKKALNLILGAALKAGA